MSQISIIKKENLHRNFIDGFSAERILEETCPEVTLEMCVLKAGESRKFEVYSREDKMQIFAFTGGDGMIRSGK